VVAAAMDVPLDRHQVLRLEYQHLVQSVHEIVVDGFTNVLVVEKDGLNDAQQLEQLALDGAIVGLVVSVGHVAAEVLGGGEGHLFLESFSADD